MSCLLQFKSDFVTQILLTLSCLGCTTSRQEAATDSVPILTDFQEQTLEFTARSKILRVPTKLLLLPGSRLICYMNDTDGKSGSNKPTKVLPGVPVDCLAYINEAVKLTHPSDMMMSLPEDVEVAIKAQLCGKSMRIRKTRIIWAREFAEKAIELDAKERLDMPGLSLPWQTFPAA